MRGSTGRTPPGFQAAMRQILFINYTNAVSKKTNTTCLAFKLGVKRPRESSADLCVHQLPALLPLSLAPEKVEDDAARLLFAAGHLDGGV